MSSYGKFRAPLRKVRELGPRWVDVGGLYSFLVNGEMKETYTAGSNTTIGVGVSIPGDFGSFSLGGTFTQTSSGTEPFPTKTGIIVNEQTPYTFGVYNTCDFFQLQPEVWVLGHREVTTTSPHIDKCSEPLIAGDTFTRKKGTAGTFKAGVDLTKEIGIKLSAQSGHNNQVAITYTLPSGGFLCGSNNYASASRWIIMDPCNTQGNCTASSTASVRSWARSRGASHPAGTTSRSR